MEARKFLRAVRSTLGQVRVQVYETASKRAPNGWTAQRDLRGGGRSILICSVGDTFRILVVFDGVGEVLAFPLVISQLFPMGFGVREDSERV